MKYSRGRVVLTLGLALCAAGVLTACKPRAASPAPSATGGVTDASADAGPPTFVGSDSCRDCHAAEHAAWSSSQHAHAMQPATPGTVLAVFDGRELRHRVERVHPVRVDGAFYFEIAGANGDWTRHAVRHTFGIYPLQQYLVEQPKGRLQAFTWCWDARPAAAGGQRWFYLYPDDTDEPGTPLHWDGLLQNWNHQCAECHVTDVRKGYVAATDTFDTRMAEARVGCEACHGPGSRHAERARSPAADRATPTDSGLLVQLSASTRTVFAFNGNDPIAHPQGSPAPAATAAAHREVEACGQCHARRGTLLAQHEYGKPLADTHRVALLEPSLYFADGQMQDEVFNYGSFLQSRMYAAGVTCAHCHEPHSGQLRAEGNALCAQCHQPTTFDTPAHRGHESAATATQCTSCHMPARTYMVVDPRHDHGFRRPDPLQSAAVGAPDVCTACHQRRDARWAAAAIAHWHRPGARPAPDFARALQESRGWTSDSLRSARALVGDTSQPPIVRASALRELNAWAAPPLVPLLRATLLDADPLVREAAAAWLESYPPELRVTEGARALQDPVRSVRLAAVRSLASVGKQAWPAPEPAGFRAALEEYRASLQIDADRVEGQVGLASLAMWEGDAAGSEAHLRVALRRDPASVPAATNLADLMRATGRDAEGEQVLRAAIRLAPQSPELQHALGLLYARTGRASDALTALGRATTLAPDEPRFAYVHGVALHDLQSPAAGIAALERAVRRAPGYPANLEALAAWHAERGESAAAERYRGEVQALWQPVNLASLRGVRRGHPRYHCGPHVALQRNPMTARPSAGARLRAAVTEERPLQVVGTINAYSALLAERAGFKAIYLSGAGVANTSFGLPDLGITSLNDVCEDVRRIASATDLPLLVDADTGWGAAFNISRTISDLVRSGAAGCHLEDQVQAKRCGHRPGKALVTADEMVDRIKAGVDGRTDDQFVIMARTDAHAVEGQQAAIERAHRYVAAGADMIFAEALTTLDEYRQFTNAVKVPVLANITEFGKTPLFTVSELASVNVGLVLYPLSAFRAMARAAETVYGTIRRDGTQKNLIDRMQTRTELYDVLGYHEYERKLDELFSRETAEKQVP